MTPDNAFDALLRGEAEARPPDALDYSDTDQTARSVEIDGEIWIILLRRGSR